MFITVGTRSYLLTGTVSKSDQGNMKPLCCISITFLVQILELQKDYANTPGVSDLVQMCLQVRNCTLCMLYTCKINTSGLANCTIMAQSYVAANINKKSFKTINSSHNQLL